MKKKKLLTLIAFWVIGAILIVGGVFFYKHLQSEKYDHMAVPYIKKVVPIISTWDVADTKALMAPEILAKIPADKFERGMAFFSQLGELKQLEKPSFAEAFPDEETEIGKQTIIEYNVDAVYEKGPAKINLKLLERNGTYEIYRFNFSAEALMPKHAEEAPSKG